jgi:mono/diheme cytochrome c family protein
MKRLFLLLAGLGAVVLTAALVAAPASARPTRQNGDVEHGKYIFTIAGCGGCHTGFTADGRPDTARAFAGGQEFNLGPLGSVVTSNLTSDVETGLGGWSDEEIKTAIRSGRRPDGSQSFPVMPYTIYSNMAEADLDAIVAYLRTLPAISNKIEFKQILPVEALPQLPVQTGIVAPAQTDTAARGRYLLTGVIGCTDCHTPLDPQTGAPMIPDKYFAGGQPYEGPWGIVYAANITPDEQTGIGSWSDDQIKRVFREGIRIDGRRIVLMPWQEFSAVTDEDLNAIVNYLHEDVAPVNNAVPAAALNPGFVEYVEQTAPDAATTSPQLLYILIGLFVVLGGVVAMAWFAQRTKKQAKP